MLKFWKQLWSDPHLAAFIAVLTIGFATTGVTIWGSLHTRASTPYVIAVFGDYGCQPGSSCAGVNSQQEQAVANLVLGWNPDAIITLGDNSYDYGCAAGAPFPQATANNCSGTNDILADQAPYNQPGGPIKSGIFYPTVGNHDDNFNWNNYLYGGSATCTSATVESDVNNCSYVYDRPPHYVAHLGNGLVDLFGTNSNGHDPGGNQAGGAQSTWYNNKASSSAATWKIEAHHHPRWSSGEHGSNTYVDWTVNNSVDLFLAGHDHNSEHIVKNGKNYIVSGTGGRNVRTGTTCEVYTKSTGVTYNVNGLTITDPSQSWDKDKLAGRTVTIAGQTRTIISSTATTMTLNSALSPVPADGTQYTTSDCVAGSVWHDDTHFGAVKLTITNTQLKAEYYSINGTVQHSFSIYKGTTTGSASGTVTSNGIAVPNAKVSYADGDTYTDANGNFSFSQLPTGSVTLSVTAPGYQDMSQSITVNNGSNTVSNFSLTSSGIIFASSFETGTTNSWSLTSANVAVCSNSASCPTNNGNYAVEANTTTGPGYLQKNTGSTYSDLYTRMYFNVKSRSTNVSMIYDRTASSGGIFHLLMDTGNKIVLRNDVGPSTTNSCTVVSNPLGQWHQLETHVVIPTTGSGNSTVEAWLDGALVTWAGADAVCSTADDTTSTSQAFATAGVQPTVGQLIIGDTASTGRTFDMLMDDGAFSNTGYIGSAYGNVSGQVVEQEGGAPISGATVTANWTYPGSSSTGSTSVTADGSGNYTFANTNCRTNHTGCVPGNVNITLTASKSGFADSPDKTIFVGFNSTTTGQNFALSEAGGTISGTVTDVVTGATLGGATIANAEGIITADGSGFYTQFLEPETISVTASHANYQSSTATVTVPAGGSVTQNFALTPLPGTFYGNIKDSVTNANLNGATVSYSGGSTTTDSNGDFILSNIPAEVAYTITVSHLGYTGTTTSITLSPSGYQSQNFTLAPNAGTITGTVTDKNSGAVLSGVSVAYSGGGSTTTNASGQFTFNNVSPEVAYAVTSSMANYATDISNVVVSPGAIYTLNISLNPNPGTITGNVKNAAGTNLEGAKITYKDAITTTDANGNYTLANVPANTATALSASYQCYATNAFTAAVAAGGLLSHDFSLAPETNTPPTAKLTVTVSATDTLTVSATAANSTDPDCTPIAKYTFDFGDGTIVGPQNSPLANHSYARAGTYTTTLTVEDSAGAASKVSAAIKAGQTGATTTVSSSPTPPSSSTDTTNPNTETSKPTTNTSSQPTTTDTPQISENHAQKSSGKWKLNIGIGLAAVLVLGAGAFILFRPRTPKF